MLDEAENMCPSSQVLSPFREETGDEVLTVLPRHTKVIVTGNNRTKSVLVGLQGVVKKAVGLGGWHWLVLKNGIEVKLQRNALSVLEHPSGNEDDDHPDFDSSSGSETGAKDHDFPNAINFPKISKPRVRHTRPRSTELAKPMNRGMLYRDVQSIIQSPQLKVNFMKLGTDSLFKYCKHYKLVGVNSDTPRQEMLNMAERHFSSHQQRLTEAQVIVNFVRAAKKMKSG